MKRSDFKNNLELLGNIPPTFLLKIELQSVEELSVGIDTATKQTETISK